MLYIRKCVTRSRAANTTTVRRAEAASSPTLVLCVQPKQSATDASSNVKYDMIYLTAIGLTSGGSSIHLHTNNT